jgi:hypothetical protein
MAKSILMSIVLILFTQPVFSQKTKRFYATILDEANQPVGRGFLKSAGDSGIAIMIDDTEIFIYASEISTIKIEKNPSKTEFLKLGTSATSASVLYLIGKNGRQNDDSSITDQGDRTIFVTTITQLLPRIETLVQELLEGANDIAHFSINKSQHEFSGKLRLIQQYSFEKEGPGMVVSNESGDGSNSTESSGAEGNKPDAIAAADSGAASQAGIKAINLSPGIRFVRPSKGKTIPASTPGKSSQKPNSGVIKSKKTTELLRQ